VIFFIGFAGAFSTVFFLARVRVLAPAEVSTGAQAPSLRRLLPEAGPEGRHYLLVVGLLFFVNLTSFMTAPLLPQYYVNTLNLSDDIISVGAALTSILVFLLSLGFPRLSARLGNRKATALGIGLLSLQNLSLAGARGAGLFIVAAVAAGIANGVLSAAAFNWHLDSVPRRDQSVWVAWNSTLTNLAALAGSLLGPVLAGITGATGAFIFLAGLRLLIAGTIYRWGNTPISLENP
jgi:MFS family permease